MIRWASYALVVAVMFADWYTTMQGFQAGFTEQNPVMGAAYNIAGGAGMFLLKAGFTATLLFLIHKAGPVWWTGVILAVTITGFTVLHNFSLYA